LILAGAILAYLLLLLTGVGGILDPNVALGLGAWAAIFMGISAAACLIVQLAQRCR
jgi:hypothetical protein